MRGGCILRVLLVALIAAPTRALVWQDILTLDCHGVAHLFVGTPIEMHVGLAPLKLAVDFWTEETRARARCMRSASCPSMTDSTLETLYVAGIPMLLNALTPLPAKVQRPAACNASTAFGSGYFDDTPAQSMLLQLGLPPLSLHLPPSCSLASYLAGGGCNFTFTEPTSRLGVNVAVDQCPNSTSSLPYIAISVSGAAASFAFKPCSIVGSSNECGLSPGSDGGSGLICRGYGTDPDELWNSVVTLADLVSTNFNAELASCAANGLGGKAEMARRLRSVLYAAWGLPLPTDGAQIAVCLPSNDVLNTIVAWFKQTTSGGLAFTTRRGE